MRDQFNEDNERPVASPGPLRPLILGHPHPPISGRLLPRAPPGRLLAVVSLRLPSVYSLGRALSVRWLLFWYENWGEPRTPKGAKSFTISRRV